MQLDGARSRELSEALREAYTRARLTQMVRHRLDLRLEDVALGDDLQEIVFKLIEEANRGNWAERLILAARASSPTSPKLQVLAQKLGLALGEPSRGALERTIRESNSFLDVAAFRARLGELENRVCKIEIPVSGKVAHGTGFLVADDVVMTNYHVIEPVLLDHAPAASVRLGFDYKRSADGQEVQEATEVRLAEDWEIDLSPYHPDDLEEKPPELARPPDRLDYALLRLREPLGALPAGAADDPGAPPRGFVAIPTEPHVFAAGQALFILQHPDGAPLQLAIDTDSVRSVNDNRTRVRYATNTEGGSSGSPCFNADWQLVALHHSGDPNWDPGYRPQYNQGIPIAAIRKLLALRGKDGVLGETG